MKLTYKRWRPRTSRDLSLQFFPTEHQPKQIPRFRGDPFWWRLAVNSSDLSSLGLEKRKNIAVYNKRKGLPKRQQKVWHVEMSQMFKHVNFETVISLNFRILFLKDFKLMAKKKMTKKSRHLPGQVVMTSIVTWVGNGIFATCSSSWIATAWCTSVELLSTKALLRWCEF